MLLEYVFSHTTCWEMLPLRSSPSKGVKRQVREQVGGEGGERCFNAVRKSQILPLLSSSRGCPPNSLTNHSCHF